MRQYIYKTIIAVVALIIVFEFTIGKTINKFNQKAEIIFNPRRGADHMEDHVACRRVGTSGVEVEC